MSGKYDIRTGFIVAPPLLGDLDPNVFLSDKIMNGGNTLIHPSLEDVRMEAIKATKLPSRYFEDDLIEQMENRIDYLRSYYIMNGATGVWDVVSSEDAKEIRSFMEKNEMTMLTVGGNKVGAMAYMGIHGDINAEVVGGPLLDYDSFTMDHLHELIEKIYPKKSDEEEFLLNKWFLRDIEYGIDTEPKEFRPRGELNNIQKKVRKKTNRKHKKRR